MYDKSRLAHVLELSDDLRKSQWKGCHNIYAGHCYVVSEWLYHYVVTGYRPMIVRHEGGTHWYLWDGCQILDATSEQFETTPPYKNGKGCGFLTKQPSKRCVELNRRIESVK